MDDRPKNLCYALTMEPFFEFDREKMTFTASLPEGELKISKEDLEISFFSGGPGGQNVNKNQNGVRLIYRIPEEFRRTAQKTRELVTRSMGQRSREQNLTQAFSQLAEKLRRYFYVRPERKSTRVPKKSKEKRLHDKKFRSQKKQSRQSPKHDL